MLAIDDVRNHDPWRPALDDLVVAEVDRDVINACRCRPTVEDEVTTLPVGIWYRHEVWISEEVPRVVLVARESMVD